MGSSWTRAIGGHRYFLSLTDGRSCRTVISFLKDKSDRTVLEEIKAYKVFIKTKTGQRLKAFCADNGKEFSGSIVQDFCRANGIQMEFTAPYSPSQNGV